MELVDLAVSWGRVGMFAFGGGPSMIPLMKTECVDLRHWMTDGEFMEVLALGNSLPGPIAAKMSAFVGWKVAGAMGVAVAFGAVMGPPMVMMLLLMGVYLRFQDKPAFAGAMRAVKPAVVGMLIWTVVELFPDGVPDWKAGALCLVAVGALLVKVHPALVMAGAMGVGALVFR